MYITPKQGPEDPLDFIHYLDEFIPTHGIWSTQEKGAEVFFQTTFHF
jgi:hypothetical protein